MILAPGISLLRELLIGWRIGWRTVDEFDSLRMVLMEGRLVRFSWSRSCMLKVTDVCPTVTWTGCALESWMRELGRRVSTTSRSTVKRRVIADTDWDSIVRRRYKSDHTRDSDNRGFLVCSRDHILGGARVGIGAGGGIRTHEGLRHRVLSPRQAIIAPSAH